MIASLGEQARGGESTRRDESARCPKGHMQKFEREG